MISVKLLDVMGTDADIAASARVSYGNLAKETTEEDDNRLIRYLMRHRHTSPFEMAEMKFLIHAPIFVARQLVRHRTANWNEISGRYTVLPADDFWEPSEWRGQATKNKQGSEGTVEHEPTQFTVAGDQCETLTAEQVAFVEYNRRIGAGVSNEVARSCLPLSVYTSWVMKMDLHNLFHLLTLRLHPHAQEECRIIAEQMDLMVQEKFPMSWLANVQYCRNAMTLSTMEMSCMQTGIRHPSMTDSEWQDFLEKKSILTSDGQESFDG